MNLRQINELWNEYKEKYDLPKDVQISAVQYDAEKYVEGFFNILELLDGKYILHLNPRIHLLLPRKSFCERPNGQHCADERKPPFRRSRPQRKIHRAADCLPYRNYGGGVGTLPL